MKVRFRADADLDGRVLRGLRRVAPEIDVRSATDARLARVPDIEVLRRAAEQGRVLVSQDRRTMPAHFRQYIKELTRECINVVIRNCHVVLLQGKVPLAFNSLAHLLFEKGFPGFLRWLFWSVDGRFLNLLHIENILFPARSQFVLDQVFP